MKKNRILLGLIFLYLPLLYADVYVKGILHVKGGYRYGRVVEDINAVQEWWFSKNRITFQSTGWNTWAMANEWRLTLDKQKKRILAVNLKANTFVEILLNKNPIKAKQTLEKVSLRHISCHTCADCTVECTMAFKVKEKIKDIIRVLDIPDEFLV